MKSPIAALEALERRVFLSSTSGLSAEASTGTEDTDRRSSVSFLSNAEATSPQAISAAISTQVFNVKDYGAKGNGSYDDRSAIQSAINAMKSNGGGTLYLPAGEYRISRNLVIDNVNDFEVSAVGASLRPFANVRFGTMRDDVLHVTNCKRFTINGLRIDGNNRNRGNSPASISMRMWNCSSFRMTGLIFYDSMLDDLYLCAGKGTDHSTAVYDGVIENSTFDGARRNAITVIHGYRLQFNGNTIKNVRGSSPASGIDIESNLEDMNGANHDITIKGNTFSDCAETGVRITGTRNPRNITVDDNEFVNCPTGVRVTGFNCRVINNTFRNASRPSSGAGSSTLGQIVVTGIAGEYVEINANTLTSISGMTGIYTHPTWVGEAVITNNVISDMFGSEYGAIRVYSNNATITGNEISRVDGIGIAASALNAEIRTNILSEGEHFAIWTTGKNHSITSNVITNYGLVGVGRCICTISGDGGCTISGNAIRKTDGGILWDAIYPDSKDSVGSNTLVGVY